MDRGAWRATDHGVAQSQTRLTKHPDGRTLWVWGPQSNRDTGLWRAGVQAALSFLGVSVFPSSRRYFQDPL